MLSLAASRLLTTLLYGIKPLDPITFVAVPLTLGAVAIVACLAPAWRAVRIDPLKALKRD